MFIAARFLLLCAAVLALPTIAAAQPPLLAVERVWTQDAGGNTKTVFASGDTIEFVAELNNSYGGAPLSVALTVITPFYNNTKLLYIAPGRNTWIWNSGAPSKQDNYTVTVKAFNSFYRVWAMSSANFAVQSSPHLSPGWYKSSMVNEQSPIMYEDSSGLKVMWGNSYVYQYQANNPLYWYVEVIYLNKGNQTLPISCIGEADPSIIKEHMRGTGNSGSMTAEETFCSRNPNFTSSIKPGGAYYEWAIFHNVPWKGGEVSLEISTYGVSQWVDPWYSHFTIPPPAECPYELVALKACKSGPLLMRLP